MNKINNNIEKFKNHVHYYSNNLFNIYILPSIELMWDAHEKYKDNDIIYHAKYFINDIVRSFLYEIKNSAKNIIEKNTNIYNKACTNPEDIYSEYMEKSKEK